jgi:hypothetical protein
MSTGTKRRIRREILERCQSELYVRPCLISGPGIAVREVVMKRGHQRIDHLLYVDKAVGGLPRIWSKGVAEMKRVGSLCSL